MQKNTLALPAVKHLKSHNKMFTADAKKTRTVTDEATLKQRLTVKCPPYIKKETH
jgi:hypothetical protein